MAKIEVKEIVGQFLDGADFGQAEYSKAYRIAIRGLRKLNWDVKGLKKEMVLNVRPDLTADLPDDYLAYIELGVPNSNGTLATLTENENLNKALNLDVEYEDDYIGNNMIVGYDRDYVNSRNGIGSVNNIGEFRIDTENGVVLFDPCFCYREVVMKYNSRDIYNERGEYTIDERCSEALLAFIIWQWYCHKAGIAQVQKNEYKQNWLNEQRLAKARVQNLTAQKLNDASRQSVKSVIKS